MSYYFYNNNLYYYLNDEHYNYGDKNNTGWYIYEDNDWNYYCDTKDKSSLGDDLYYHSMEYSAGSYYNHMYDFVGTYAENWNPTDFKETSYYESYKANEQAYNDYIYEQSTND